ncbi:MAG: maleylpyruvate isomerase N-terminal domain-containing protein [Acidimicrobiales bacterium]
MESRELRDCLEADFRRLRDVAAGADLDAAVPSCSGWTMADLLRHVGAVYLHKVECMRLGRQPDEWPPEGLNDEPPLSLLDRSYAALSEEFANRRAEDGAFTWYEPDQSVGFWIRRMAQETVIHRVDAELGAGASIAPIAADLAADGIDELLVVFVQYATTTWPEDFGELLDSAAERTIAVATPERSWLLHLGSNGVRVEAPNVDRPDATVKGSAPDVLLWLWNRRREGTATAGDEETIELLGKVLVESTQ